MFKGLVLCAMGVGLIILCVMAYIAWWGLCFGSVLLGIVLLIFAPHILFLPNLIGVPGISLFFIGLELMFENSKENIAYKIREKKLKNVEETYALIAAYNSEKAKKEVSRARISEFKDQTEAINARRAAINLPPLSRKPEVDDDDSLPF